MRRGRIPDPRSPCEGGTKRKRGRQEDGSSSILFDGDGHDNRDGVVRALDELDPCDRLGPLGVDAEKPLSPKESCGTIGASGANLAPLTRPRPLIQPNVQPGCVVIIRLGDDIRVAVTVQIRDTGFVVINPRRN
jgi:hypothetical protein